MASRTAQITRQSGANNSKRINQVIQQARGSHVPKFRKPSQTYDTCAMSAGKFDEPINITDEETRAQAHQKLIFLQQQDALKTVSSSQPTQISQP